ncbi:hypothetical protein WBG78_04760 [Chryseolinea sp. T2]|uniref:hypothetical protein n=1 Tax=Chryseolinea sp. T2 TaxID=3129255 RepID=UPI003076A5F9
MTSLELIAQGLLRAGDVRERIHYLRVTGLTTIVPDYPKNDVKLASILRKFVTNSMDDVEEVQFESFLKSYLRSDHFREFKENGDFERVQRSIEEWRTARDSYFAEVEPDDRTLTPIVPVYDSEDSHDLRFEKLANCFLRRSSMTAEERFQFIHFLGYEYLGKVNLFVGFRLEFIDLLYSQDNLQLERLVMSFLNRQMNQKKWHAFATYLGYDPEHPGCYENVVQTRRIIGSVKYWREQYRSEL